MTREEQETVITWDRATAMMNIYTADPALIRRLKGLQSYKLIREHKQGGQVVACDFEAEKRCLTLRSKPPKSNLTEEQRKAASERLRAYHNSHSEQSLPTATGRKTTEPPPRV